MKRNRGDEPIGVIIKYMEISQGNPLYSYLCLKQSKMSFWGVFCLFSLTKLENRRVEKVLPKGRSWYHSRNREGKGKQWRR
jgi:hypothetical protein